MTIPWPLGENVARTRRARGLSQEDLADRSGVSVDTIARLERGQRQMVRSVTLARLARGLGVDMTTLLGILPPLGASLSAAGDSAPVAALRQALTASAGVPGLVDFAEQRDTATLDDLRTSMGVAWSAYLDGRHEDLLYVLPCLIADSSRFVRTSEDPELSHAYDVLGGAYRLGAGVAGRFGLDDLAFTAAEHALEIAQHTSDPELFAAVATRYLVWVLIRQGRHEEAENVAVAMAERIEPSFTNSRSDRLGVFGNLLFNAGSAAARSGRAATAEELLVIARSAAARAGLDRVSETAIFGPRSAGMQAVDQALRLGDPEKALTLAGDVPAPSGPVPRFWEAGHQLHEAAAAAELRQEDRALRALADAAEHAPDWVRHQPLGVAVMRELIDRAPRRMAQRFERLATLYGVIPA